MSRVRQFTIVFHNVKDDAKPQVEAYFDSIGYEKFLQAMEPYPQSDGYHIHVFVQFKNPRRFTAMLEQMKNLSKRIMAVKPEGCQTDWGRVQIDRMYGTFDQATAYLKGETKDKPLDPNVELKDKRKDALMEKYLAAVSQYHQIYWYPQFGEYLSIQDLIQKSQAARIPIPQYYLQLQQFIFSCDNI